jgi:hypothetical protein
MVAVFDNPDAPAMLRTVMEAAGLDTAAYALSTSRWAALRSRLRADDPTLVIVDVRAGRPGRTS